MTSNDRSDSDHLEFSGRFKKSAVAAIVLAFAGFTLWVDTGPIALQKPHTISADAARGKLLYQRYNCQACHQIYGLGGYLGPDLTNAYSTPGKGADYIAAFLRNGTAKMPNFHLAPQDVSSLVAYLAAVDATGSSPIKNYKTTWYGSIEFTGKNQ